MIFIKAFGLVAARVPVLRQTYQRWPWPHIYQHPTSVAMVATHRDFQGEPWLFWSRFSSPEAKPLDGLQAVSRPLSDRSRRDELSLAISAQRFPHAGAAIVVGVDAHDRRTEPRAP